MERKQKVTRKGRKRKSRIECEEEKDNLTTECGIHELTESACKIIPTFGSKKRAVEKTPDVACSSNGVAEVGPETSLNSGSSGQPQKEESFCTTTNRCTEDGDTKTCGSESILSADVSTLSEESFNRVNNDPSVKCLDLSDVNMSTEKASNTDKEAVIDSVMKSVEQSPILEESSTRNTKNVFPSNDGDPSDQMRESKEKEASQSSKEVCNNPQHANPNCANISPESDKGSCIVIHQSEVNGLPCNNSCTEMGVQKCSLAEVNISENKTSDVMEEKAEKAENNECLSEKKLAQDNDEIVIENEKDFSQCSFTTVSKQVEETPDEEVCMLRKQLPLDCDDHRISAEQRNKSLLNEVSEKQCNPDCVLSSVDKEKPKIAKPITISMETKCKNEAETKPSCISPSDKAGIDTTDKVAKSGYMELSAETQRHVGNGSSNSEKMDIEAEQQACKSEVADPVKENLDEFRLITDHSNENLSTNDKSATSEPRTEVVVTNISDEMDISDSQLCEVVNTEESSRHLKLLQDNRKQHLEGRKIIHDLIIDLSHLNQLLLRTKREIEAVRRKRQQYSNNSVRNLGFGAASSRA